MRVKGICSISGEFSSNNMWQIKKSLFPQSRDPPMAKKDANGNVLTSSSAIKSLYVNTYHDRLSDKDISSDLKNLRNYKEVLCEKRLDLAKLNKSEEVTVEIVDKVLKGLTKNKARDPLGLANELFKEGVIGTDLKNSICLLLNKVKDNIKIPELAYLANITTIYKGNGDKAELNNSKGLFTLKILRMILDKVVNLEEYEKIDDGMSDSNAGARKEKNYRNHSFIVNEILHEKKVKKGPPIDIRCSQMFCMNLEKRIETLTFCMKEQRRAI